MTKESTVTKLLYHRPKKRVTLGTLFGIISLVLFVSYNAGFFGAKLSQPQASTADNPPALIEALQQENTLLQKELIGTKRKYEIQTQAQKNLGEQLALLEQKNTELNRDMSLYQTLAKSHQGGKGIEIKSFQVFASDVPNAYRYLIVLSKESSPEKFAQGAVRMVILGRIGDREIQLPVKYVDSTRADGLGFKFRHLQELAGELSFPDQFEPHGVQFSVIPDKEWPQYQRHFNWATDNPDIG